VSLPYLDLMPRVPDDIDECLEFIARQPWGKAGDRRRDILRGIRETRFEPKRNAIKARRRDTGLELRRHNAAQFAIIYAYFEPDPEFPNGVVSIRSVRHRRVRNVFGGVREPAWSGQGPSDHRASAEAAAIADSGAEAV
jgi:hypothetical protein